MSDISRLLVEARVLRGLLVDAFPSEDHLDTFMGRLEVMAAEKGLESMAPLIVAYIRAGQSVARDPLF